LIPHPSQTIVGISAKKRIDSHPHHTVYNAKRILGKQFHDPAVQALASEVEFAIFGQEEEKTPETPVRWATIRVPDDQHGHYQFRPHEIGGYVLMHLRNMVARHLGHDNVRSAVICVPAKFTPTQRQYTVNAYQLAGFHVLRIIEEPTAAALAYGLHRKPDVDYILVYDFGGGTLDVSLLHVSEGFVDVLGVDGDDRLGGADFDSAIARYFVQQHNSNRILEHVRTGLRSIHLDVTDEDDILAAQCPKIQEPPLCTVSSFHTLGERIKIKLSENYYAHEHEDDFAVTAECWGLEESSLSSFQDLSGFCSALTLQTLSLTRLQFANLAQPLFDRSLAPVKRLLSDLEIDDVDEIVMVGGTTRMPQIRSLVAQQFPGKPLNVHIDPDITVAYGAASVVD
jgi:molecular chaperone DnaK (HSP70)